MVCTLYGDASCPEGTFCDPEPAGTDDDVDPLLVGEHLCTETQPGLYTPADDDDSAGDDDDTSVGDDDSAGDDDDDSSLGDDDSAGDDDDDSSAGDDDTSVGDDDDDDSIPENYIWERWDAFPAVASQALYGVSFPEGQNGCVSLPAENCHAWAVGTGGTVVHSSDGGVSWQPQHISNSGGGNWQNDLNDVYFVDHERGWIVGEDGLIAYTINGGDDSTGQGWVRATLPPNMQSRHFLSVFVRTPNVYVTTRSGAVWRSNGGGQQESSWGFTPIISDPSIDDLHGISGSPHGNPKVWAVGDPGGLLPVDGPAGPSAMTDIGGTTDTQLNDIALASNEIAWIVGDEGTLLYSDEPPSLARAGHSLTPSRKPATRKTYMESTSSRRKRAGSSVAAPRSSAPPMAGRVGTASTMALPTLSSTRSTTHQTSIFPTSTTSTLPREPVALLWVTSG